MNQSKAIVNGRYGMQSRTNVHFLVFHLTLADAIVCFITMPMETIWRIVIEVFALQSQIKQEVLLIETPRDFIINMHWICRSRRIKDLGKFHLQWYAGNLACKALMMVRTGGYIIIILYSSSIPVPSSIDVLESSSTKEKSQVLCIFWIGKFRSILEPSIYVKKKLDKYLSSDLKKKFRPILEPSIDVKNLDQNLGQVLL